MADPVLRARVAVDGEQEFRNAIKAINGDLGIAASEMRKVTAQYQDNANSIDALTAKGEVLEKRLISQREKVDTLREALEKEIRANGEASEGALALTRSLNNAEAAVFDTEAAIRQNNEAMEEARDAAEAVSEAESGLGTVLDGIAEKFGLSIPEGIQSSLDSFGSFSTKSVVAAGAAAAAVAAVTKGVKELQEMTLQAAANVDDLVTQSMVTGLSVETLQKLRYAESLVDVSVSTISNSLSRLTRSAAAAQAGGESTAEAFRRLGVSISDTGTNELRDAESIFYDVIDALGEIENATERDAIAMELLGRSAQELNPLILQGSAALQAFAAEAEAAGYVLDSSQIEKLGEVDDAYQRLQLQIAATRQELAAQFAPSSVEAMDAFSKAVGNAGKALSNSGIIRGVGELFASVTGLLDPLTAILGLTPEMTQQFGPLYSVLHAIAGDIAWIADTANAAIGVLTFWSKEGRTRFNTAMGLNAQYGMYSNLQRWDGTAARYEEWRDSSLSGYAGRNYGYDPSTGLYYDLGTGNYIFDHNAGGTDYWRGGWTWVGEAGPERVRLPAGSQILSNQESRSVGGDTFVFNISAANVREFNELVEMAESARVRARMR